MVKVRLNRRALELVIAKRNMSQNMLAIRTGSSGGYISQLMRGVRYPSPKIRQKILDALSPLTFDDLFIIIEEDQDDVPAGR